ncbi:MAG: hypothetical protein JSW05_08465 [Candidatus Thorarchaeota archaeon]|nr:MAG: hypothetical protein JSW05_08465 [Candidatus Thorarchaeota archaeon]
MPSLRNARQGRYRDVSELRVQFLCEYRLHLKWNLGERISDASVGGTNLHQYVPLQAEHVQTPNMAIRITVLIMTVLAALLWIFG